MQRLLPALAAFALVALGLAFGLVMLTARDRGGIGMDRDDPGGGRVVTGPAGLPVGNVLVEYESRTDLRRLRRLAEDLGAEDGEAARAAGQAIVTKRVGRAGVTARSGADALSARDATDSRLADFVRDHLGRSEQ